MKPHTDLTAWVIEQILVPLLPRDFEGDAVPCKPTHHLPCSESKIRVMMLRRRRRQNLFHPEDARFSERQALAVKRTRNGISFVAAILRCTDQGPEVAESKPVPKPNPYRKPKLVVA